MNVIVDVCTCTIASTSIEQPLPSINIGDLVLTHRIANGISFQSLIKQDLPFKIPITYFSYVQRCPTIFQQGYCEYDCYVDNWLNHDLLNLTLETSVVAINACWQFVLKHAAGLLIYMNEEDASID
jgi:hypothetical protein